MWYTISGLYTVIFIISAILQPQPWDAENELKKLRESKSKKKAEEENIKLFTIKETGKSGVDSSIQTSNQNKGDKLLSKSDLKSPFKSKDKPLQEKIDEMEESLQEDYRRLTDETPNKCKFSYN